MYVLRHMPSWLRSIMPKYVIQASRLTEEAWNAYPYTLTRYRSDAFTQFRIDIETLYCGDAGGRHNVFELRGAELADRQVDVVNFVSDAIPPHEYREEEDARLFQSVKTGRGPLSEQWLDEYGECDLRIRKGEYVGSIFLVISKEKIRDVSSGEAQYIVKNFGNFGKNSWKGNPYKSGEKKIENSSPLTKWSGYAP